MATQHPDNASIPFWHDKAFISTQDEIEEIYQNFSNFELDEYMWDWEGKFADEALFEKLFNKYLDFFKVRQIGKDIFITLRIPNIWEEKTFKLARSYISVLSSAAFCKSLGLHAPPVFEIILPMTRSADQLIHIQDTFEKTQELYKNIFQEGENGFGNKNIKIIPLFESIDDLAGCAEVLETYLQKYQEKYKSLPDYMRSFIARSDPALNAGFVPAVIASRMALREFYRVSEKYSMPIYPIIGTGSLPFRGGVNPNNIENILAQYKGVKTFTVQSAFRYDYNLEVVKKAIKELNKAAKKPEIINFSESEFLELKKMNEFFRKPYCQTIESTAEMINDLAKAIPRRRERVQHIGLFGYNRGIGKTKLPRAISFTSAWYNMGIPPEFIGTGRGLKKVYQEGMQGLLEKHFPTLRSDLIHAGKYLNLENLEKLANKNSWASDILQDVKLAAKYLQINIGPQRDADLLHRNLTSTIMIKRELNLVYERELVEAAIIRKSIG